MNVNVGHMRTQEERPLSIASIDKLTDSIPQLLLALLLFGEILRLQNLIECRYNVSVDLRRSVYDIHLGNRKTYVITPQSAGCPCLRIVQRR
jgi:hypothetical protein